MNRRLAFLRRKLAGIRGYSPAELVLVAPALVLLGVARLAILCVPFRYYARILGSHVPGQPEPPSASSRQIARGRAIGRCVRATASITPWQSVCLPQAMAAAILLRMLRVPYVLYFSLAKDGGNPIAEPMRAHAWLQTGDLVVTGGPIDPEPAVLFAIMDSPPA